MKTDLRENSLLAFTIDDSASANTDMIKLGAILRIADAVEKMSVSHTKLIEERDTLSRMYKDRVARVNELRKSNAALRGVITKMKREGK